MAREVLGGISVWLEGDEEVKVGGGLPVSPVDFESVPLKENSGGGSSEGSSEGDIELDVLGQLRE